MTNPDSSGNYNKPTIIVLSFLAAAVCILQAHKNNTSKVVLDANNQTIGCKGTKSGTRYSSKSQMPLTSSYEGSVAHSAIGIHCLPHDLSLEKIKSGQTQNIGNLSSADQQKISDRKFLP